METGKGELEPLLKTFNPSMSYLFLSMIFKWVPNCFINIGTSIIFLFMNYKITQFIMEQSLHLHYIQLLQEICVLALCRGSLDWKSNSTLFLYSKKVCTSSGTKVMMLVWFQKSCRHFAYIKMG